MTKQELLIGKHPDNSMIEKAEELISNPDLL